MGGRIFAVDDASIAASLSSGRFQLKELSIVPRLVPGRPVHNIWLARIVGTDAILMDPFQRRKEGERQYSQALLTAANASFGPSVRPFVAPPPKTWAAQRCSNTGTTLPARLAA